MTNQETTPGRAADAAMAGVILALGVFLAFSGIAMLARWRESAARMQSLQLEDLLGVVSAGIGSLIVAWWLASMMLAVVCAALHKSGHRRAAAAVGKASPAFMRRLALAALGLQLVAGPAVAQAAPVPMETGMISAAWAPTEQEGGHVTAYSSPQWAATPETAQETAEADIPVDPHWKPTAPLNDPRLFTAPQLRTAPATGSYGLTGQVAVMAGDSLWTIAARALGPDASDLEIALDWPRWYEANRAAIGDNPDVLLPGQILQAPSAA